MQEGLELVPTLVLTSVEVWLLLNDPHSVKKEQVTQQRKVSECVCNAWAPVASSYIMLLIKYTLNILHVKDLGM